MAFGLLFWGLMSQADPQLLCLGWARSLGYHSPSFCALSIGDLMALLPVMQHMVLIFTHIVVFTDNFSFFVGK